jgi:hypothetical protein
VIDPGADFLRGSYPPLVTPFADGAVDYDAYASLGARTRLPLSSTTFPAAVATAQGGGSSSSTLLRRPRATISLPRSAKW